MTKSGRARKDKYQSRSPVQLFACRNQRVRVCIGALRGGEGVPFAYARGVCSSDTAHSLSHRKGVCRRQLRLTPQMTASRRAHERLRLAWRLVAPLAVCAILVAAALFTMPSVVCAQPAVPVTDRAPGTRVKFRSESLALLVPVSLNGAPRLFFVDTGATMTAVDRSFRDILGVALRTATVRTPDGKAEMDVFKAPPATIAGGPLTGVREVLCLDLSGVRGAVGDDFYGILGMDFSTAARSCFRPPFRTTQERRYRSRFGQSIRPPSRWPLPASVTLRF